MRRRRRRWKLVTRLWLSGVILAVVAFIGLPVIDFALGPPDGDAQPDSSVPGGEEEAQTVRLKAESDGVIYADKPDETSGDEPELVIDKQPHSSALIRFKLSDVSADITSARLRLHALTPIGSPLLITLTENTWSESGLSFNNRPSRASGIVAESFLGDGSWIEVDVTELIPESGEVSFQIEQSSPRLTRLSSRESSHPPELNIILRTSTNEPPEVSQPQVHVNAGTKTWTPSVVDPDNDPLECWLQRRPQSGVAELAEDCSSLRYRPNPGSIGGDEFAYVVHDGRHSVMVPTEIVFDTPVGLPTAASGQVYVDPPQPTQLTLRGNDPDGRCPIRFELADDTTSGVVGPVFDVVCSDGHAAGSALFEPTSGFGEEVVVGYTAIDRDGQRSEEAGIRVTRAGGVSSLTIQASQDGVVSENDSRSINSLRIDAEPPAIAFISFDVPATADQVASAYLSIFVESSSFEGIDVHAARADWSERSVGSGTAPQFDGTSFANTGPVWGGQWIQIPLPVSFISGESLAVALTTSGSRAISMASRESFHAPELSLTLIEQASR